ncbi:hypothetical protein F4803DRAFT_440179 [Xylaria telfairii]|nr:hypothetical protein F4803DRAFT_440179 [Xylaria telfairii]
MSTTWFLLPDFTFTANGPLRLGMMIPHWSKPTTVLATIGYGAAGEIELPPEMIIVEPKHVHSRSVSRSTGLSAWAKFESLISASAGNEFSKDNSINYGETDHEIHTFKDPLTPEVVTAIANIPAVRAHIESGMFGKRPIYIISGMRIATSSFTVTKEVRSGFTLEAEASGPPPGTLPFEIGGTVKHDGQKSVADSYQTAPGIVFAYRLHVIRTRRTRAETGLFSHKSAFLTGATGETGESLTIVEATEDEINEDLEEEIEHESVEIGDREFYIYRSLNK